MRDREEGISSCQVHGPPRAERTLWPHRQPLPSVEAEDRIAWVSQALCRTTDPDELFVRGRRPT